MIKLKKLLFKNTSLIKEQDDAIVVNTGNKRAGFQRNTPVSIGSLRRNDYVLIYGEVESNPISKLNDMPGGKVIMMALNETMLYGDYKKSTDSINKSLISKAELQLKTLFGTPAPTTYSIIAQIKPNILDDQPISFQLIYPYKDNKSVASNKMLSGKLLNNWERGLYDLNDSYKALYAQKDFKDLSYDNIKVDAKRELIKRFINVQQNEDGFYEQTKNAVNDLRFKFQRYIDKADVENRIMLWVFYNNVESETGYSDSYQSGEWRPTPWIPESDTKNALLTGKYYVEWQLEDSEYERIMSPDVTKSNIETFESEANKSANDDAETGGNDVNNSVDTYDEESINQYAEIKDYFGGGSWQGKQETDTAGNNVMNGPGIWKKNNYLYKGMWKDNKIISDFYIRYPYEITIDKYMYEGDALWDDSKDGSFVANGSGILTNTSIGVYVKGEWENNKLIKSDPKNKIGQGAYKNKDKSYIGEVSVVIPKNINDIIFSLNGLGTLTWNDGTYTSGTWVDGNVTGDFTIKYIYSNKDVYEGQARTTQTSWVKQGVGKYTFKKTGKVLDGTWDNDKFIK